MSKQLIVILIFIIGLFSTELFAQTDIHSTDCYTDNFSDTNKVFTRVENKPHFKGGDDAFLAFLLTHFNSEQIIRHLQPNERTFSDTARAVFIITKDSKVSNLTVSLCKDTTFKQEVIRLIKNSSCSWKPGDFGRYVTSWYQLDIYLNLERRRDEIGFRFKIKHFDYKTE
jgi:hypothetical protein